jgi:hypothetical protein
VLSFLPGKGSQTGGIEPARPVMTVLRSMLSFVFSITIIVFAGLPPSCAQSPNGQTAPNKSLNAAPQDPGIADRRKKLVLKDGTFQLIREFQRNGERVRYFSAERGDWEEIPAAMVDWDATAKAETAAANAENALLKTVHHQQEEQQTQMPMDVDASLLVAAGTFLPPGEGMFVVEGKSVTPLNQVSADIRNDKKQRLKQVLSPIPIIPSKRNIEIPGGKATRRINSERPEFYLREPAPDPDSVSIIKKSSRPGETGPEIELVRLTVKGGKRQIESIQSLFGQEISQDRSSVPLQRWDVAKDVYRFTLGQELSAGEYAFAEILPDGVNLYVWDFGVDRKSSGVAPEKH